MAVTLPPSHGVNVLFVRGELHHCRVGHALKGGGALEPQVVGVHLGSVIAQSLIVLQVVQVARCRVGWAFIELSGTGHHTAVPSPPTTVQPLFESTLSLVIDYYLPTQRIAGRSTETT